MTDERFNNIYNTYHKLLLYIAFDYVHNKNDSEDIIQEVFMKLYNYNKNFIDDIHLKNWLIKVTNNLCIDYLRHNKNKEILVSDEWLNSFDLNEESDFVKRINDGIEELNIKDKEIIILYYYNDLSLKEISDILRISEVSAQKRISRAREKLRKIIGDKNG